MSKKAQSNRHVEKEYASASDGSDSSDDDISDDFIQVQDDADAYRGRIVRRVPLRGKTVAARLWIGCLSCFSCFYGVSVYVFGFLYSVVDLVRRLFCLPKFIMSPGFWVVCGIAIASTATASFAASLLASHAYNMEAVSEADMKAYSKYALMPNSAFKLSTFGKMLYIAYDTITTSMIFPFVVILCLWVPVFAWTCFSCCCPCFAIPIQHIFNAVSSWLASLFGSSQAKPSRQSRPRKISRRVQ